MASLVVGGIVSVVPLVRWWALLALQASVEFLGVPVAIIRS
jgi:hypothetical protein